MVSDGKLVKKQNKTKTGGVWRKYLWWSDKKLVRKEAGLETALRDVRSKACEKRGGAWGQCYVMSDRKLVRKEAGLGDSVT